MRVKIEFVVEVDDDYRRAINAHYGQPGLASRAEIKRWFEMFGQSMNDDLSYDIDLARERKG